MDPATVTRLCSRGRFPKPWPEHPDTRWQTLNELGFRFHQVPSGARCKCPRKHVTGIIPTLQPVAEEPVRSVDWYKKYYRGRFSLKGLSGLGLSQSWYSNLNRVQNDLVVVGAEIATIGAEIWDRAAAAAASQGKVRPWPWDLASRTATGRMTQILVTESHIPSDAAILQADNDVRVLRSQSETVKQLAPGIRAEAEAQAAATRARVSAISLRSPEEAGFQAFKDSIAERAGALAPELTGFFGLKKYIWYGVGGMVLFFGLPMLIRAIRGK